MFELHLEGLQVECNNDGNTRGHDEAIVWFHVRRDGGSVYCIFAHLVVHWGFFQVR